MLSWKSLLGTIQSGQVIGVPHSEVAGLLETGNLYVRSDVMQLWNALDAKSGLVQGPPGIGKSIAVWSWLMAVVRTLSEDSMALWCHFRQVGQPTCVTISWRNEEFQFTNLKRRDVANLKKSLSICVMDGVRNDNRASIDQLAENLEFERYYVVTSQQVTIPEEQLKELGWGAFDCSSWTPDEIDGYAATFSDELKATTKNDFVGAMTADANGDPNDYSFEDVIGIKKWFFGGSARYIFGLSMNESLKDLARHVDKITDVDVVLQGLAGSRSVLSVDHILAYFPGNSDGLRLSNYVVELLSRKHGFAAIRMFYRSSWIRNNPVVHGFVFEWDLFTQVEQHGQLILSTTTESKNDVVWHVEKDISLKEFLGGDDATEGRVMVRPERWNHPEYDGLYIHTNEDEELELVAWNASEAKNRITEAM